MHDKYVDANELIQRGAILEQYLNGAENLTNEEVGEIVKYAFNTAYVKDFIKKILVGFTDGDAVPEGTKGAIIYHKRVVVSPGTGSGRALSEGSCGWR